MKKVILSAYINNNLGDDLFIKILCERFPNTKFILFLPKKTKFLKSLPNVHTSIIGYYIDEISYKLYKRLIATKLLSFFVKTHVHIGGSLFIENSKWRRKLNRYSLKVKSFEYNFLIGCNFGPFEDENYLKSYKKVFNEFTDISFRDTASLKLFSEMDNVRVAPDLVLSYSSSVVKQKKSIGIALIDLNNREELKKYEAIYLSNLKEIIKNYSQKSYSINLFSFCEEEGDFSAANSLKKEISINSEIHIINYTGNIEEFLKKFNAMEIIVASRFHAMILGLTQNSQVIPLTYSEKMISTLNDLEYTGLVKKIKNLKINDYKEILSSLETATSAIDVKKHSQEAISHFTYLDKHFKR